MSLPHVETCSPLVHVADLICGEVLAPEPLKDYISLFFFFFMHTVPRVWSVYSDICINSPFNRPLSSLRVFSYILQPEINHKSDSLFTQPVDKK